MPEQEPPEQLWERESSVQLPELKTDRTLAQVPEAVPARERLAPELRASRTPVLQVQLASPEQESWS